MRRVGESVCERTVLDDTDAGGGESRRVVGDECVHTVDDAEPLATDTRRDDGDAVREGLDDLDAGAAPKADRGDDDVRGGQLGRRVGDLTGDGDARPRR